MVVAFMASAAWAGLGLPNELVNPGLEGTSGWSITGGGGLLSNHLPYSYLAPFGVGPPSGGGSYCGGVAGQNVSYPGGQLWQIVDEAQFPGWNPDLHQKIVEVEFWYRQVSYADVPMNILVALDYMEDGGPIDPGAPNYVYEPIGQITNMNSGGWKFWSKDVVLPVQPRYLSLHFDFTYFSGTGLNIIDLVDLQGKCIPEPTSLLALATGLLGVLGVVRRRR